MSRAAELAAWRRRNPDNVARHRAQHAARMRAVRAEAAALRPVVPPTPEPHLGHPLFDLARQIVHVRVRRTDFVDDLRSEIVLAALEGRDPAAAVRQAVHVELEHRRMKVPLTPGLIAVLSA